MVIVKIKHGLGNQMFQYAMGRSLARQLGAQLILDTSYYASQALYAPPAIRWYQLDNFRISPRILGPRAQYCIGQLRRRWLTPARVVAQIGGVIRIVVDKERGFDETLRRKGIIVYLDGYWQSERYFADLREPLLDELSLREPASPDTGQMLARINEGISVCVHIRHGDYASNAEARNHWPICSLDYYKSAMAYIGERVAGAKFYLFSDDIPWIQSNFPPAENIVIVSGNAANSDLEDFRLMMNCRHFIIANSSFSWWAAWLGKQKDKIVVAPKEWHRSKKLLEKDIVPDHWVRL
jgi:hypothetical protein